MSNKDEISDTHNHQKIMEIMDSIRDSIDASAMKMEAEIIDHIKELRRVSPQFANAFEESIEAQRSKARFGVGNSAYLKTQVIIPLIRDYKKTEDY